VLTGLIAVLLAGADAAPPQALPGWMAGSWTAAGTAGEWTEEWWTPPRAGIMLGASRSGKAEALGFFEHMRIVRSGGGVAFCAMPQGQASTCFQAVAADAASITFENPAHDFPQRVAYRREGDQLVGEISGLKGERLQRWRYRRLGD
jgi:hypothetical protein